MGFPSGARWQGFPKRVDLSQTGGLSRLAPGDRPGLARLRPAVRPGPAWLGSARLDPTRPRPGLARLRPARPGLARLRPAAWLGSAPPGGLAWFGPARPARFGSARFGSAPPGLDRQHIVPPVPTRTGQTRTSFHCRHRTNRQAKGPKRQKQPMIWRVKPGCTPLGSGSCASLPATEPSAPPQWLGASVDMCTGRGRCRQ